MNDYKPRYGMNLPDPNDPDIKYLNRQLKEFNLGWRARKCLDRAGLNGESKVFRLIGIVEEELLKVKGLGKATLEEIRRTVLYPGHFDFRNYKT